MYIYYNVHDNQIDEDPPLTNHATRIISAIFPHETSACNLFEAQPRGWFKTSSKNDCGSIDIC